MEKTLNEPLKREAESLTQALRPFCGVKNPYTMPDRSPAVPLEARSMYGTHLLNHLTADRTAWTAGQIAVITLL